MMNSRRPSLEFSPLRRVELVQLAAAVVFGIAVFLPWYTTDGGSVVANISGHRGSVSAWIAHPVLRWFLLAAVTAGLVSAWHTITGQSGARGVHRGEMSAVVALFVVGTVLFCGLIERPGSPSSAISLSGGWLVALVAALVALWAASARLPRAARRPPGA